MEKLLSRAIVSSRKTLVAQILNFNLSKLSIKSMHTHVTSSSSSSSSSPFPYPILFDEPEASPFAVELCKGEEKKTIVLTQ